MEDWTNGATSTHEQNLRRRFANGSTANSRQIPINLAGNTNKCYNNIYYTKEWSSIVHIIGKIDKKIYRCITTDITTDEVIITDTQIQHIKEHHPNDYEQFSKYFPEIVANPDYILKSNKPNTAVVLKEIIDGDYRFQTILRLCTSKEPSDYKNSIITFMKIDKKRWERYLRTKEILYKRKYF